MQEDTSLYPFKHRPETCDPEDLWRQVTRTQKGQPVSEEQITLIVDAVTKGLSLGAQDHLLDLCCGNGALTTFFFQKCAGGLGVDYSDFMIEIAKRRFVHRESEGFLMSDALHYLRGETRPQRFTKILCYGAFPYFPHDAALEMLRHFSERFVNVSHVYLGQLPDKTRMDAFYTETPPPPGTAEDPGSTLGLWRTPEEMIDLAHAAGWKAECIRMPADFFASHYRFDALLTRP